MKNRLFLVIFLVALPFCVAFQVFSVYIPFYTKLKDKYEQRYGKQRFELLKNIETDGPVQDFCNMYSKVDISDRYYNPLESLIEGDLYDKLDVMPKNEGVKKGRIGTALREVDSQAKCLGWLAFLTIVYYGPPMHNPINWTVIFPALIGSVLAHDILEKKKYIARLSALDITSSDYRSKRDLIQGKIKYTKERYRGQFIMKKDDM